MSHRNSPLTPEGKRRLIERLETGRPIAHVASEMGISRQTATKWWGRYQLLGPEGLAEASSRPHVSPSATADNVVELVIAERVLTKWGAARLSAHMKRKYDIDVSMSTVHRILTRHDMSRTNDMDTTTGEVKREFKKMVAPHLGYMVHVDVKKVGRIPDGGGWFIHGQGTDLHRKSKRAGVGKVGYIYIHSAIEAFSRLAYSEVHLNEQGKTAAGFWLRAAQFYAKHGITSIERCMTDNGSAYRSHVYNEALESTGTKHRFTPPYTPRVNGKVERFNQILKKEWLFVRGYESEAERIEALSVFLNYYNHERAHGGISYRTPAEVAPSDFRLPPQPMVWPDTIVPDKVDENRLFDDITDWLDV